MKKTLLVLCLAAFAWTVLSTTTCYGSTSGNGVNDAPFITGVSASTDDGYYGEGAEIFITIEFDQAVAVDEVNGTPFLDLNIGTGNAAFYDGGSGTNTLTFRYQVGAGDNTADLDYTYSGALSPNGGSIRSNDGIDADLTLPAPGDAGSLGSNKNIGIDTNNPQVSITLNPNNPSNSPDADFEFTGDDNDGSGIAGFECQLDDNGFSSCTSPQNFTGLTEGTHNFDVRAIDKAGNVSDPINYNWLIDLTKPTVIFDITPNNPTNNAESYFEFTGFDSESGIAGFECQLDGTGFNPCSSGLFLGGLSDGSHTFDVRAIDNAGNISQPISHTWVVDVTVPTVSFTNTPSDPSNSAAANFAFTGDDGAGSGIAGFECQLNGNGFSPCASPQEFFGLSDDFYNFEVRAIDNAGNVSEPINYNWRVDATAPTVNFTTTPGSLSNSSDAYFEFSGDDGDGSGIDYFECQLDGGGFSFCSISSPGSQYLSGLSDGSHTFEVRAIDFAGNQKNISHTWTINTSVTCAITAISIANRSNCEGNNTHNTADDTYTADVTITFINAPGTGTLVLAGAGSASVEVGSLNTATQHTFTALTLPADGGAIELTATFSDDNACTFTESDAGTAPNACSPTCSDGIQNGDETAVDCGGTSCAACGIGTIVTITAFDAAAAEAGSNPGTFRISRTGATTSALNVSYTISGSATNGTDYTSALTGTATIAAGQTSVDITITPVDDANIEGNETATLTLVDETTYDLGATTSATVTIADNDMATVALSGSTLVSEAVGTHNAVVTLSTTSGATLAEALVIPVNLVNNTAVFSGATGDMYLGTAASPVNTTNVTFPAGSGNGATQNVTININDDRTVEASTSSSAGFNTPENFNVAFATLPAIVSATTSSITMTIDENDFAYITMTPTFTINDGTDIESNTSRTTNVQVRILANGTGTEQVQDAFTVPVQSSGLGQPNDATPGADYTAISTTVTFPAGSLNNALQPVPVTVINDEIDEFYGVLNLFNQNREFFDVGFNAPAVRASYAGVPILVPNSANDNCNGTGGLPNLPGSCRDRHTNIILDNDQANVVVTESSGNTAVVEGGAGDTYTVVLATQPTSNVTVNLSFDQTQVTVNGDTDGATSLIFTMANWATPQAVSVFAVNDALVEGNPHTSLITQTITSTDLIYNAINPADVTVSITDNDLATIVFANASRNVAETTASHNVTARLDLVTNGSPGGTLSGALTANVDVTLGTAESADFTQTTTQVTFAAGSTNGAIRNISFTMANDLLLEGDENFTLSFGTVSGTGSASGSHVVTITDNESGAITFTAASSTAPEGTTPHNVGVQLAIFGTGTGNAQVENDVTVAINNTPGTATTPADYTTATSIVTFSSGTNSPISGTVANTIVNDALVEATDETFSLGFGAVTGSGSISATGTHTVTIDENDTATVAFSAGNDTVSEAVGVFSKTVTLTITSDPAGGTLAEALSISYGFDELLPPNATATEPEDFTLVGATIDFPPGSTNGTTRQAQVNIINDLIDENAEFFEIKLNNNQAVIVSTPNITVTPRGLTTVQILDNETANITVNPTTVAINEDGPTSQNYTVVLATQPTANVTINLTFNPTQITVNGDTDGALSLTFTAANWNTAQTVTVQAVDDFITEGNHSITITQTVASSDAKYNALNPADVTVNITDNDTPGSQVVESNGSTSISEANVAASDSYTIRLDSRPTQNVTVNIVFDAAQISLVADGTPFITSPATFIIVPADWNVLQTVEVIAIDDNIDETDPHTTNITQTFVSTDANYNTATGGVNPADVTVNIADNEVACPASGILYVNANSPGGDDGLTWNTAFDKLQDALTLACNCIGTKPDIWVAQGTYYPDEGIGKTDNNRSSTFNLCADIKLYGGFQGISSDDDLGDADPAKYKTVLSGDLKQDDQPNFVNYGDNAQNVVTIDNVGGNIIMNGFYISGGEADNLFFGSTVGRGAGVYILANGAEMDVEIRRCVIQNNRSNQFAGGLSASLAFANQPKPNIRLAQCAFDNNHSDRAGALSISTLGIATIKNCVFKDNYSSSNVLGTIYVSNTDVSFVNCTFDSNEKIYSSGEYSLRNSIVLGTLDNNGILNVSNTLLPIAIGSIPGTVNDEGGNTVIDPMLPLFFDANDPDGADDCWRTADDGLALANGSQANNKGNNSFVNETKDIIGALRIIGENVDLGAYESPCPTITAEIAGTTTICPNSSTNLTVNITGGAAPYTVVYSPDGGTTQVTVNNYQSGANIAVTPSATTTYTLISVTDAGGCTATLSGSAVITVEDTQAPEVTKSAIEACYPTTAEAEAAARAATTAKDNCTAANELIFNVSTDGTCAATITVKVTDKAGNSDEVTYNTRIDNTPPTVTAGVINAAYPTVQAAEAAALAATSTSDNCPGDLTKSVQTTGTCNAEIKVTVTDGCGNSNFVSYNTIIDNEKPQTPTLPDVTGECSVTLTAPTTTDNCTGTITGTTSDPITYSQQGTFQVTWTFEDGNGNSTTAIQKVMVDDISKPAFTCLTDRDVNLNDNCEIIIPDLITGLTGNDNCGTVTFSQNPTAGSAVAASHNGTVKVTITADDGNDNTITCEVTLTGKDVTAPTAVCKTATITLSDNGTYTLQSSDIDNNSSDNCGIVKYSFSKTAFTCADIGKQNVTLTVEDAAGLKDDCTVELTILASAACEVTIANANGPTIKDPCTCSSVPGLFDEEIIITGNAAGENWVLSANSGFLNPNTGTPYPIGTAFTFIGNNQYSLVGRHQSGVGYNITATSAFYPNDPQSIGNQCNYLTVEAGNAITICQTKPVNLVGVGSVTNATGIWSTSGDGQFVGGTKFGETTAYLPGVNDKKTGKVTLTLTAESNLSNCDFADQVEITILKTDCGQFPWKGQ